jgi:hypothetical protein
MRWRAAVVALAGQARAMARDVLYVTGMGADQAGEALATT